MSKAARFYGVVVACARWIAPRILPSLAVLAASAATVFVASNSRRDAPLDTSAELAWTLLTIGLQWLGVALFARIGRVSPTHARSAVRHLTTAGRQVRAVQNYISDLRGTENGVPDAISDSLVGSLDVLADTLVNSVEDWRDVHPQALVDIEGAQQ